VGIDYGKSRDRRSSLFICCSIRPMVKNLFAQCGLDDPLGHFYAEMDSWKLWELDANQPRRTGIKTLAYEWLRQ
jgi:hypothetical protein